MRLSPNLEAETKPTKSRCSRWKEGMIVLIRLGIVIGLPVAAFTPLLVFDSVVLRLGGFHALDCRA